MKTRAVGTEFKADTHDVLILAFRNSCAHALEAYKGRGGIAAFILNLRIALT
jgi:hypothetical protein